MERKGRRKKAAIEEDISNLPCDVIYTILSKLPVKSLLRFRCVCKPWRALISEPQFIKSHLNEAIKLDRQRVICSVYQSKCFYSVDYESCGESKEQLCFPIKKYRKASVLGSCNGVLLFGLYFDKMCMLWNPSTREYKRFSRPYSQHLHISNCGICYDSSIDDYKVVSILQENNYKYFMVYTCKNNSWTERIELSNSMMWCMDTAVTVSGAPHWVVSIDKCHKLEYLGQMHGERGGHNNNSSTPSDDPSKDSETSFSDDYNHFDQAVPDYLLTSKKTYAIVYFDVVEEKFKKVPPPNWICAGNIFRLTSIRGCLGIYLKTGDWQQVDVWVMKEYGDRNSWTKLITIPSSVGSTNLYQLKPVCYTKKGEVVLMSITKLVVYDPKESKLRNMTPSLGMGYPSTVGSFVDSLVLPTSDKLTKKQRYKHKENGKRKEL